MAAGSIAAEVEIADAFKGERPKQAPDVGANPGFFACPVGRPRRAVGHEGADGSSFAKDARAQILAVHEGLSENGRIVDARNRLPPARLLHQHASLAAASAERLRHERRKGFRAKRGFERFRSGKQPGRRGPHPGRRAESMEFPFVIQAIEGGDVRHRKARRRHPISQDDQTAGRGRVSGEHEVDRAPLDQPIDVREQRLAARARHLSFRLLESAEARVLQSRRPVRTERIDLAAGRSDASHDPIRQIDAGAQDQRPARRRPVARHHAAGVSARLGYHYVHAAAATTRPWRGQSDAAPQGGAPRYKGRNAAFDWGKS